MSRRREKELARAVEKAVAKRDRAAKLDETKSRLADGLAALREIIAARTAKAAEAIPKPAPAVETPAAPSPPPTLREQWQAARREGRMLDAARLMSVHGDRILSEADKRPVVDPSPEEAARAAERSTAAAARLSEYEQLRRDGRTAMAAAHYATHGASIDAARKGRS